MASNKRIVGPKSTGTGWQNVNPSGGTTSHRKQETAIKQARTELRRSGGGELIVEGRDGQIRDKYTVGRAKDPRSTSG